MSSTTRYICVSEEVVLSKATFETDYMVLESNRMIGFYSNVPHENQTPIGHHYFLLMKKGIPCFQDRVFRSISFYAKDHDKVLHVYPGHMNVHGNEYNFIRFRQSEFDDVMGMLSYFEKRNIEFVKSKRFSSVKTVIQFKELVQMEEIMPNVYRDKSAHHVFFLPISIDIEFLKFDKMLSFIRNNCDFKHFEASLVYSVNSEYKIDDFAKIYSPNCEESRLVEFEENFIKAANEFDYL